MYSIKAVSQATGLSVEALRAWERRYAVVTPHRDDLGRRVYRPEDVLRLRRLREATERGHPIGRLSQLSDSALAALLEGEAANTPLQASCSAFVTRILEASQNFRAAECEQALTLAIALLPPAELIRAVLQPLLQEIGARWHRGDLTIAQERMVSSAVRKHVSLVLDSYDRTAHRAAVVFATLPGERHELGLLMSAMVCASRGFKVHYLGADMPAREIAEYARETGAGAVALSVLLMDSLPGLPEKLGQLSDALPKDIPVWIGGAATNGIDRATIPANCIVISSHAEFEQRLEMLAA
jgi:methanogenic corrinoid protein MtbC1